MSKRCFLPTVCSMKHNCGFPATSAPLWYFVSQEMRLLWAAFQCFKRSIRVCFTWHFRIFVVSLGLNLHSHTNKPPWCSWFGWVWSSESGPEFCQPIHLTKWPVQRSVRLTRYPYTYSHPRPPPSLLTWKKNLSPLESQVPNWIFFPWENKRLWGNIKSLTWSTWEIE